LLSSFYGAAQESANIKRDGFAVIAEDPGQGHSLNSRYLGMKNSGTRPAPTKFASTAFAFTVKVSQASAADKFDALRLVWHDYPGEWFEQGVSGVEEEARRVEGFRDLLQSDVAVLMIDAQRLLDNAGEEERYLKSLFTNFSNGLLRIKDDLLSDGKLLVQFPRIWVLALSKCDLMPDMNVEAFRDLMIEKGADDIEKLRGVLGELVDSKQVLSVGEDFVLLSSAKFEGNKIEVTKRVGLNLLLPLASVFAFERHLKWAQADHIGKDLAVQLLQDAEKVALAIGALGGWILKIAGSTNKLVSVIGNALLLASPRLEDIAKHLEKSMSEADAKQTAKRDGLAGVLARFRSDLENAEEESVFQRSLR
jgi:hypothetical protein